MMWPEVIPHISDSDIRVEMVVGNMIFFTISTYVECCDSEIVEKVISNRKSYVYDLVDVSEHDDVEKLIRKIFISEELRVRTCAAFKYIPNGVISPVINFNFDKHIYWNCIPNIYVNKYGTFGSSDIVIKSLSRKHDYTHAIEECALSIKRLFLSDIVVAREFFKELFSRENCIELPDKRNVGYKDAIKWLEIKEESL